MKKNVTDLVLHRRDGAIRHPVHLVGQRSDKVQFPMRHGRAACLVHLRCRYMLGLAALVTQVLERADDKTKGLARCQ